MKRKLLLLLLICISSTVLAQTTKTVKLKATVERLTIHHYNISGVVDDRKDTSNIGTMRAGLTNRTAFVNLPNGARAAISGFIEENLWQSPVTDTFELHILNLNVKESVKGFSEKATLNTQYGFFRNGKKIIDYSGNSYVQTGMDASAYIGKLVTQSIEQVLKEFDGWWAENRNVFDDSKRDQLKVNVTIKPSGTNPDEIIYNAERPLTIADFKGTPDALSKALAATYSGFVMQYEMQGDYTGNTANVELVPYFEIQKSWMKSGGKTAYVLQHEQLHFDITAIKTYELAAAIKSHNFTVANFKEEMAALQKQYSKEMELMQTQYDGETSHGIFKENQNLWQARIKNELKEKAATAGL
jgi:hypothetical protein